MKSDETTWLLSELPLFSCCCTDNAQITQWTHPNRPFQTVPVFLKL